MATTGPTLDTGCACTVVPLKGAIGTNDAVVSFTKVLSEQAVGEQSGISHGKTLVHEAKHPTVRGGRKKNQAGKGADLKRSNLEPLVGVSPAPIHEVPHNVNVRIAAASLKGSGDVRDSGRAQASMGAASPAQASTKLDPNFVKSQLVEPGPGGSPNGEVAAVAETTQGGGSSEIGAVEVLKTPPLSTSVTSSKASVIATPPETSGLSAVQAVSDPSQRAAAPTDSEMAGIAKTSASEASSAPWSAKAAWEMQISGNPFPVSREFPPTRAGTMERSVSGGLVNSIPMPAESARPATPGKASRYSMAGSAMSATAHLNFLQVQKAEGSTAIVGNSAIDHSSVTLDVKALSEAISRPLVDGNGSHTIVVAMHPADLGQLEAVVSVDRTALQVSLAPQTQTGHLALAHAMDALKSQLAQSGMNVNVTLRDPGSQPGNEPRQYSNESPGAPEVGNDGTSSRPLVSSVAGQIHLVL